MTDALVQTSGAPVFERLSSLLDRLQVVPTFGPVVTDDYRLGYSAARNDAVPLVDAEITDLLDVYEVLDVAVSLFTPEKLGEFLTTPITALDGESPIEVMRGGDAARVLELLAAEFEGQVA
jgi:hypothetical protein